MEMQWVTVFDATFNNFFVSLQKRKRIDFDSKDVEILEQVWRDGLRSICKKNSVWIHTTAEKLGTTETRVEVIVSKKLEDYSFGIVHPSGTIGCM